MSNYNVVITGGSAGIGAALAELLTRRGDRVVLVARRLDPLVAEAKKCGPLATPIAADLTEREQVRRVVREAAAAMGSIDVWVNNAGQGISRQPTALTAEDVEAMVKMNVLTVLYGMQEVLPHFAERGKGQIINISSMLGRVPYVPFRAAYTGAKHYVNALTASFRAELAEIHPGVVVTLVSPGVVRTEFGIRALHGGVDSRTLPNSQSAEEVAEVIAGVIGTRRTDVYTRKGAASEIAAYYRDVGEDP